LIDSLRARINSHHYYGYTILASCLVINMCIWGVFFSVGLFFKPMLNEFGWSRAITSGPISLSWVVSGLLGITMGALNDRFGPRIVVMICGTLFGMGCLLMSQIQETWQIYLYYGVLIGSGLSLPIPIMSTVSRWFEKRRTVMTGVMMLGSGVAGLAMPPLASWIILTSGWRTSYIIFGAVFLCVIFIAAQFLKRDPSRLGEKQQHDISGYIENRATNDTGLSLKQAISTVQFWLIFVIFFCFSANVNTLMVHLVPHVTDLGISTTLAATLLTASNAAGIAGRTVLGGLGDRLGNRRLFMVTFILLILSFTGLIFTGDLFLLYLMVIIFGIGYGAGLTQESPIIARLFGLKSHGIILGVSSLGHTLGAAAGTLLAGYLFDTSGDYRSTFIICGICSAIGLILVLILQPVKSHRYHTFPLIIM